jgi:hypothetical protein
MNWKHEGSFESGITIWTLTTPADSYEEVTIHTFGSEAGYTLTLGSHQASRFKTLEDAQSCAASILTDKLKKRKNA